MPEIDFELYEKLFLDQISYLSVWQKKRVIQALIWAKEAHGGAIRKSGEPFYTHPLTVALYLAEYFLDGDTLIAALLHDVAEDTTISIEEIVARFGDKVGKLVEGLTKFDKMTAKAHLGRDLTDEELKNATLYKLFSTMSNDVRIGLIKIFDRLHNMRTMGSMPPHKQQEKSRETLLIYAPLADKLGMWLIKSELQALAISLLDPARYELLRTQLDEYEQKQKLVFYELATELTRLLDGVGLQEVKTESPDIFGAYAGNPQGATMLPRFDMTPQLIVLVKNNEACYTALGKIHGRFTPVPQSFDDYIASPRNLYRSLHTTILKKGQRIKIRIRTTEMQVVSQLGILKKWLPTQFIGWPEDDDSWLTNITRGIDSVIGQAQGEEASAPLQSEVINIVLEDIIHTNDMMVYTPKGKAIKLTKGATPLDFAYKVHTAVGHSCRGARVNGREVPLHYTLEAGDLVEVLRHGTEPQRAWLDEDLGYLKQKGTERIVRQWFRSLKDEVTVPQGQQLLEWELEMLGTAVASHDHHAIAHMMGHDTPTKLYHALGRADLSPSHIATKLLAQQWAGGEDQPTTPPATTPRNPYGLQNTGNRRVRLCQRCRPQQGDEVIGFIRQDNSLTVHTVGCPYMRHDYWHGSHALKLRWDGDTQQEETTHHTRDLSLYIHAHDRDGLLSEITALLRDKNTNITSLCSNSKQYPYAYIVMSVAVSSPREAVRFLHRISSLANIIRVRCLALTPLYTHKRKAEPLRCLFEQLEPQQLVPPNGRGRGTL